MPRLTRLFIKIALVYLVLALGVGALLLLAGPLGLPSGVTALRPVYYHLLMVGWATQLIFGVAFWMFPKHTKEQPRGAEPLVWWVYGGLNLGLVLRSL